ncbi:hypothetical protein [Sporolactobacillus sp. KGMB 08714]|uniref:hypothetical protein n=1 Tax=Sporolactobacillus sp. KGMB 08714 TaxID=3064704 RepID=UPI002FBE069D
MDSVMTRSFLNTFLNRIRHDIEFEKSWIAECEEEMNKSENPFESQLYWGVIQEAKSNLIRMEGYAEALQQNKEKTASSQAIF